MKRTATQAMVNAAGGSAPPGNTDDRRKSYRAPYFERPPVIDGKIHDPAWRSTAFAADMDPEESTGGPGHLPFQFAMGYDASALYGALVCSYQNGGDEDDENVDDAVTLVVDYLDRGLGYIQFIMSKNGAQKLAVRDVEGNRPRTEALEARNSDWDYQVQVHDQGWTAEFRIPWSQFSLTRPDIHHTIGINFHRQSTFGRTNSSPTETWVRSLAPWCLHYFTPVNFGRLSLVPPEGDLPWQEPDTRAHARSLREWRAADESAAPPRIVRQGSNYLIELDHEVSVQILVSRGYLRGIGEVRIAGRRLRNGKSPMFLELWEPDGNIVGTGRFRILDLSSEGSHAVLRLDIRGKKGSEGILEWRFSPAGQTIGGTVYRGFAYAYRVVTERLYVNRLVEHSTWELDGDAVGCTLHMQSANVDPLIECTEKNRFRLHADTNVGWNQHFDFQTGRQGALFAAYRAPDYVLTGIAKHAGERTVRYFDQVMAGRSRDFLTPTKEILYAATGESPVDLWTAAFEFQARRWLRQAGIRETPVVPTSWMPLSYAFATREDYRSVADREMRKLAELGFKRLILPPIWTSESGNCEVWNLGVDPKSGGSEGIRYLVDKAHQHGMQVVAWLQSAIFVRGDLAFHHPEYIVHTLDGTPMDTHYWGLRVVSMRSGYYQHFIEAMKEVREATGLDGFWIDSWSTFAANGIDYAVPDARPQVREWLRALAELQRLGYTDILLEGTSPFGVTSSWLYAGLYKHPAYAYKTSFYTGKHDADQYYRFLSHQALPHINGPFQPVGLGLIENDEGELVYRPDQDLLERAAHNHVFNEVAEHLKLRTVLEDDQGVLWTDPEADVRVLFAHKAFEAGYLQPGHVHDVSLNRDLGEQREFVAEPFHTYRLSGHPAG